MMYSKDLDALLHSLYAQSPQAYHLLQSSLQLRSLQSLQYVVPKSIGCWIMQTHPEMNSEQLAKQPHFPIHITHLVYSRAKVYLSKISYEGFCALACDDMKLLPSLQPYFDKEQGVWMIVGVAGQPIEVANEQSLEQMLEEGNVIKATKVHTVIHMMHELMTLSMAQVQLWTLQVQVP